MLQAVQVLLIEKAFMGSPIGSFSFCRTEMLLEKTSTRVGKTNDCSAISQVVPFVRKAP